VYAAGFPGFADRLRALPGPTRSSAALVAFAVAAAVGFLVGPGPFAAAVSGSQLAGRDRLTDTFRKAFTGYWQAGSERFTPDLHRVVDFWAWYHVAKGVFAALLVAVLVVFAVRLGRAGLRAGGRTARVAFTAAGALAATVAVAALAVVMANVQGTLAPFASLSTMLPTSRSSDTVAQVRQQVVSGHHGLVAQAMIEDYVRYHAVMVVAAAVVAGALITVSVVLWRRFATTAKPARLVFGSFGVVATVAAMTVLVVLAANASTVADPVPGLLGLFNGSY
jgi:hypothetical protein